MRVRSDPALTRVLEACDGITSLELDVASRPAANALLLLPALADLKQLILWCPEDILIPPSHLSQPAFRLSHLRIWLDADLPAEALSFILLSSITTLSYLRVCDFCSHTTLSSAKSVFSSHTSIRHLTFSDTTTVFLLELLPLFANLQSLCIRDSEANVIEGVVAAVAPTLEELTLAGVGELPKERARALITALHGALGSVARLRSLKRLELSDGWPYNQPTLREIDGGDELLDECARKGVKVILDDGMV